MKRTQARENIFLLLFEASFYENPDKDEILELAYECRELEIDDYVKNTFIGINNNLSEIDMILEKYYKNWTKNRISRVALSVLRLAVYEINYVDDVVPAVAINEAVNLMKKYDTQDSAIFINGVLGAYVRDRK